MSDVRHSSAPDNNPSTQYLLDWQAHREGSRAGRLYVPVLRCQPLRSRGFEMRGVSSSVHGACAVRRFVGFPHALITGISDLRPTP